MIQPSWCKSFNEIVRTWSFYIVKHYVRWWIIIFLNEIPLSGVESSSLYTEIMGVSNICSCSLILHIENIIGTNMPVFLYSFLHIFITVTARTFIFIIRLIYVCPFIMHGDIGSPASTKLYDGLLCLPYAHLWRVLVSHMPWIYIRDMTMNSVADGNWFPVDGLRKTSTLTRPYRKRHYRLKHRWYLLPIFADLSIKIHAV